METQIALAIISTAGAFANKLLEVWNKTPDGHKQTKQEKKIQSALTTTIEKHYTDLQSALTTDSVKILHYMEPGDPVKEKEVWKYLFPKKKKYVDEFEYRLRYLEALGLVKGGIRSEYRITRLGRAFLEEARRRGDFKRALKAGK